MHVELVTKPQYRDSRVGTYGSKDIKIRWKNVYCLPEDIIKDKSGFEWVLFGKSAQIKNPS